MVKIIKEEIEVEKALKKKLEFICSFCNTKYEIQKGSIRTIERTNLSYVEPHRIIIKGITFLAFNYETSIYIENLSNKILIKDLENKLEFAEDTIDMLEDKISKLEEMLNYFKDLWKKFINYLQDKFFSSDKYDDFIDELYYNDIIDDNDLDTIKNEYSSFKDDDLER